MSKPAIHHNTLRKAERLFLQEDLPLHEVAAAIKQDVSVLTPYAETWEFTRQALHTARRLYVRHGFTINEILKTVPIDSRHLDATRSEWQRQREAYLAPLPSSYLRVQRMIDIEIAKYYQRLKPKPDVDKLIALSEKLKSAMTILDQVEAFIYLFHSSFLPTQNLTDDDRDMIDTLMREFRGFLKLQVLSGNR